MLAFDSFNFTGDESVRSFDDNGFLHVSISPVTREQVAPYRGKEIPNWKEHGLNPEAIYKGYRSAKELSSKETVQSLNGIPIQFEHHADFADSPATETRIGSTGTDSKYIEPYLTNSLHFQNQNAIKRIEDGSMKELSLGYSYVPIFEKGEFKGEPYDFLMTQIRCNHVALVEEGRAGHRVCVCDSKTEDLSMEENKKVEKAEVSLAQAIVDLHKPDDVQGAPMTADADEIDSLVEELVSAGLDLEKLDGDIREKLNALKSVGATDDSEEVEVEDDDEEVTKDDDDEIATDEDDKQVNAKDEEVDAQDEDEEDPKVAKDEETEETQSAKTDGNKLEALAQKIAEQVTKAIESKHQAIDECKQSLGKVKAQAYDCAGSIYKDALRAEGISSKGMTSREARCAYRALMVGKKRASKGLAQDTALKTKTSNTALSSILNKVTVGV